ncbi:MAG: hypothetical protein KC636_04165 [Myxococcales bacterium]|nr:hypothetical protein [Myxococcales bacterium]
MAKAETSRVVQPASDPALEAEVKAAIGAVPTLARYLLPVPWLTRLWVALVAPPLGEVSAELATLVLFVVARDNGCRYCSGSSRTILRINGFSERAIDELERDVHLADLDPGFGPALDFTRRLSRYHPAPPPAELARLEALGFSPAGARELAFVAARACFITRVATFLDIPDERFQGLERRRVFVVLRPLLRLLFRSGTSTWAPPDGAPAAAPFAEFVALAGLPPRIADGLRWGLAQTAELARVPARTALLITGVIARALGCPRVEARARAGASDCGLTPATFDAWLRTLAAPEMSPLEVRALPLARETARYRVEELLPRLLEFSEAHEDALVIEVLGLCALANLLCRLEVIDDRA